MLVRSIVSQTEVSRVGRIAQHYRTRKGEGLGGVNPGPGRSMIRVVRRLRHPGAIVPAELLRND